MPALEQRRAASTAAATSPLLTPGGALLSSAAHYLPSLLVDALSREPERPPAWIEPVQGTLVMADISGFTRMSEQLASVGKEGAEWLTNTINQYFQRMLDVAANYGGSNLKFGGDALLLLFTGEEHAARAACTALEMQQANREFPIVRLDKGRVRLRMSIGVHSGSFWSASAGLPERRMQHFVLGGEASRVAQVEAVASPGEVLVSGATGRLLKGYVTRAQGEFVRVLRAPRLGVRQIESGLQTQDVVLGQALIPFLPPPVASALATPESAAEMTGEHRKAAVIFIHLLGVDEVVAKDGPEALLGELQSYVSCLATLAGQYGGYLAGNDIYTSDLKLIVLFGAPVAHEGDPANALRLAIDLQHRLPGLGLQLRHRIGANSGFVFAGDVGSSYRREYTVMGDAVNLAARLMSAAVENQVLASRRLVTEAGAGFTVTDLPAIRVKGKREPVAVCSVEGEASRAPAPVVDRSASLVGRDAELERLRTLCREVESGAARSAVVQGEPGIGKSRLTADFRDYLAVRGWTVLRGRCQAHTAANPFAPWTDVLASLFDLRPADGAGERTEKVLRFVEELSPELREIAALLGPLLSLSIAESNVIRSYDEETRRRRLFELISALLAGMAKRKPLAVILEDLHWADHSSLQLASFVTEAVQDARLLLCVTQRPVQGLELEAPAHSHTVITLGELSEEAAAQLVRQVLRVARLPAALARQLLSKSRGNPLFLEEIARSLRLSGALDRLLETPAPRLAEAMAELAIPDRVQGLIMSRLDRLEVSTKEALRAAAVIGSAFDLDILRGVLEGKQDDLDRLIEALVENEFVEPDLADRVYRFRHALIQEVAYDALLFSRRRQLHRRVGSYLEEAHSDNLEPFYEVLAHHYRRGGDRPKTLVYSLRAGEKARRVFANDEAMDHYLRALAIAEDGANLDLDLATEVHVTLADILELTGSHQDAIRHYRRALRAALHGELSPGRGSIAAANPKEIEAGARVKRATVRQAIANICRKMGLVYERLSEYGRGLEWLRAGINVLPSRSTLDRSRACIAISGSLFRGGLYDEAASWCRRGLRLARLVGARPEVAHAHNLLGVIHRDKGAVRRAIAHRTRALDLYTELGDLTGQADTLNNLGLDQFSLGDWELAGRRFKECLEIATRIGDLDLMAIVHNNLGEVFLIQGDLSRAKAEFRWTIETLPRLGHVAVGALAEANLGEALALEGRREEARRVLERSLSAFRRINAQVFAAEVQVRLAEVLFSESKMEKAERALRQALDSALRLNSRPVEGMALLILGKLQAARAEWEPAESNLRAAYRIFRRAGARHREGKALLALGELFAARFNQWTGPRDGMGAESLFARSLSILRHLGASLDARVAEESLLKLKATRAGERRRERIARVGSGS